MLPGHVHPIPVSEGHDVAGEVPTEVLNQFPDWNAETLDINNFDEEVRLPSQSTKPSIISAHDKKAKVIPNKPKKHKEIRAEQTFNEMKFKENITVVTDRLRYVKSR